MKDFDWELLDEWWEEQFQQVPPTGQVMGYVDVVWQMVQKGLGYTLCFLPEEYTNPYGLCLTPLVRKDVPPSPGTPGSCTQKTSV